VAPPDGDMGDSMRSLEKVRKMKFSKLLPTHGAAIQGMEFVDEFIQSYASHRRAREASILEQLSLGQTSIPEMVKVMYVDVNKALHPAAAMSVLGHMLELVKLGTVVTSDENPTVRSHFELGRNAA